jgi:hypothetical protein
MENHPKSIVRHSQVVSVVSEAVNTSPAHYAGLRRDSVIRHRQSNCLRSYCVRFAGDDSL